MEPRPRSDDLVAGGDEGGPRRRNRWGAVVLVCAAVLAFAVARPDLSLHGKAPAQPRPTAGPTSDPNVTPALSAVAWDIRGDLAGTPPSCPRP